MRLATVAGRDVAGGRGGAGAESRQGALREPTAQLVDPPVVLVEAGAVPGGARSRKAGQERGHAGEPRRDDAVVHQVGEVGRAGGGDQRRHRPASFQPVEGNRRTVRLMPRRPWSASLSKTLTLS